MSKTLPHHTTNMTTRNASREKAAKLASPNRFEALDSATEEQKTFDPPTLTDISMRQNHAEEYHKKIDTQASILSTLKNYIVSKNKLEETEAANNAKQDNHPSSHFGAKTTDRTNPSTHDIYNRHSPNHYQQTNTDTDTDATYMQRIH